MKLLIVYILTFIIIYLFYYCFVLKREKILKKFKNSKELLYLKYKYKIKITDGNLKRISNKVFLVNSFIMSTILLLTSFFNAFIIKIVIGMVLCVIFILLFYHILGKYYQRKQEEKKHV